MTEQLTFVPRPATADAAPPRRLPRHTRELGLRRVAEVRAMLRNRLDQVEGGPVADADRHAA